VTSIDSVDSLERARPSPSAKRPVLDSSNLWLEDVFEALGRLTDDRRLSGLSILAF
jgi:hypothetical protein